MEVVGIGEAMTKLYLHIWNAPADDWDTRNVGIVSDSPEPIDDTDVRMRVFGRGPFKDTPRKPHDGKLNYEVVELFPGLELRASGYDRAELEYRVPEGWVLDENQQWRKVDSRGKYI